MKRKKKSNFSALRDTPVTIRRATPDDVGAVAEIEHEQFSNPWKESYFKSEIANSWSFFFVAEEPEGSAIIGYWIAWILENTVELHKIAVAARWQRRGIGSQLMNGLLEKIRGRGISEIFLEVRQSNTKAINLYNRFGFTLQAKRPDYYGQPIEDALIFRLDLKKSRSRAQEP